MILASIRLHPFAGTADKTFLFAEGLTVFCGPNEHGKSTAARAIRAALFIPTNLTPARRRDLTGDFMPRGGGDTIRITLRWMWNGGKYLLEKSWGATASSVLTVSDGTVLTDAGTVQQRILEMLPANEAVVNQVLTANQSELARAIEAMSSGVGSDLTEQLRKAVLQTGGVSGTTLQQEITGRCDGYFGRWDATRNGPEGGAARGVENPWQKGRGKILDAFYAHETAAKKLQDVERFDMEDTRLRDVVREAVAGLSEKQSFLDEHKKAYESINERISIESRLEKYERALQDFKAATARWPVAQAKQQGLAGEVVRIEAELKALTAELANAKAKAHANADATKLTRVEELADTLDKARSDVALLREIPATDIAEAKRLSGEVEKCQNKIDAQKLSWTLRSSVEGEATIQHSGGTEETLAFRAGGEHSKEVTGSVQFHWAGVTLLVASANEDIAALEARKATAAADLAGLLAGHGVTALPELEESQRRFRDAAGSAGNAEKTLAAVLNGDTLEALKQRCIEADAIPAARDVGVLDSLVGDARTNLGSERTKLLGLTTEIEKLVAAHVSQDNLLSRLVEGKRAVEDENGKLTALPPLPEGYDAPLDFQRHYDATKQQAETFRKQGDKAKIELAGLAAPELSKTDAKDMRDRAAAAFQQRLAEGQAYRKIQKALAGILEGADADAFKPLQEKTQAYFMRLTAGKYGAIPFAGTSPLEISGTVAATLPVHLLSKGTRDSLALALRLAAAESYLEEGSGFLLMDDPLVDMDTERRTAAARLLQDFAARYQTVVFTCHEAHEDLLKSAEAAQA